MADSSKKPKPNKTPFKNFNKLTTLKEVKELVIPKLENSKNSKIAYLDLEGNPAHVIQLTLYTNIEKYQKWDFVIHIAAMENDRSKALKLLKPFIEDRERILWVMHSGIQDQSTLQKDNINLMFWMDTQLAMNFLTKDLAAKGKGKHIECGSFVEARKLFLGIDWSEEEKERQKRFKKRMQRSTWDGPELSDQQTRYARDDTRELAHIYEKMLERPDFDEIKRTCSIEFKQYTIEKTKDILEAQAKKATKAIADKANGKPNIFFKPHPTDSLIFYPTEEFAKEIKVTGKVKTKKGSKFDTCQEVTNLIGGWSSEEEEDIGKPQTAKCLEDLSDWSSEDEAIEQPANGQEVKEAKERETLVTSKVKEKPPIKPKSSILGEAPKDLGLNKAPILDGHSNYLYKHTYFSRETILREIARGHVEYRGQLLKSPTIHPHAHQAMLHTVEYHLALKTLASLEKYNQARCAAYYKAVWKHGDVEPWYNYNWGGVGLSDEDSSDEDDDGGIWSWSFEKVRRKKIKAEMREFEENY